MGLKIALYNTYKRGFIHRIVKSLAETRDNENVGLKSDGID